MDNVSHMQKYSSHKLKSIEEKDGETMKKRSVKNVKLIPGFTLVELLVVISIIAVLLAILMPSLSKAKESARSTVCKTHIKQIMLAASLWSQDHDGYVVAGMWDVPDKDPGDGSESTEGLEAIARGASLQKYTAAKDMAKGNLYSCPTAAAKFGKDFYYIISSSYLTVARDAATAYGVNSFAVMYNGENNYLGSKGSICEDPELSDWGPNRTYMLEHGKSRVAEIQQPSSKVYFSDFSYMVLYDWMYDPLKVIYRASNGRGSSNYKSKNTLAEAVATGKPIVQARWHGTVAKSTGYGYGNMGWFDGSVSREPGDYAQFTTSGGGFGGTTNVYACWKYFYIKH
jgi:prepilin-type N-terminal cleavage/methylation domain-containing protein